MTESNNSLARSNNTQKNQVLINKLNQFFSELVSVGEEGHKLNRYMCTEVIYKNRLVCYVTYFTKSQIYRCVCNENFKIVSDFHSTFSLNSSLQVTHFVTSYTLQNAHRLRH